MSRMARSMGEAMGLNISLSNAPEMIKSSVSLGITLFLVSVHDRACKKCQSIQGKAYSYGGVDRGWPPLTELPPFCGHCRHILLPYIPKSEAEAKRIQALSNMPDAFVHSLPDWHRIRDGGDPHTCFLECTEPMRRKKRGKQT